MQSRFDPISQSHTPSLAHKKDLLMIFYVWNDVIAAKVKYERKTKTFGSFSKRQLFSKIMTSYLIEKQNTNK